MPPFRRVEAFQAGPKALGILVPPGPRSLVILRPRALEWDLLPIRFDQGTGSGFCDFARDEAVAVARQVQQILEEEAKKGVIPVQVVLNPGGDGYLVWVPMLDWMWLVCPRIPGRPYEPLAFETEENAREAVQQLTPFLWPAGDAGQEYYFNTQNFTPRKQGKM